VGVEIRPWASMSDEQENALAIVRLEADLQIHQAKIEAMETRIAANFSDLRTEMNSRFDQMQVEAARRDAEVPLFACWQVRSELDGAL